jgi:hypothetical protein
MHYIQSGKLFSLVNQLFSQPTQKTKWQLGFITLLLGIVTGSNAAIAQTGRFDRNEHRSSDLSLVAHNPLTTPVSDISKNTQMPNGVIAGGERDGGERHSGGYHGGEHHGGGKKPADKLKGNVSKGDMIYNHLVMPNPGGGLNGQGNNNEQGLNGQGNNNDQVNNNDEGNNNRQKR